MLKKSLLATCVALSAGLLAPAVSAATIVQDGGTITFQGSIVGAACTLSSSSMNQTVTLADIPTGLFSAVDEVANKPQPFSIALENCDSLVHTTVAPQFTGPGASADGVLTSTGTATGIGFKVTSNGVDVPFNDTPMTPVVITDGNMTIPFSADYIATAATQTAGTIASTATFKLSYQ